MTPWKWNEVDLAGQRESSFDDVPKAAGIYVWRLKVAVQLNPQAPPDTFLQTLQQQLERPAGVLPESEFPTARLGPISIGGGRITHDKQEFLRSNYGNLSARESIAMFCQSLDRFSPVIYVGKALDLRDRLQAHFNGQTELKEYITLSLQRDWRDVSVSFMCLPAKLCEDRQKTSQLLATIEMIAQLALVPHGVRRMG
jgi:hypothetical protein